MLGPRRNIRPTVCETQTVKIPKARVAGKKTKPGAAQQHPESSPAGKTIVATRPESHLNTDSAGGPLDRTKDGQIGKDRKVKRVSLTSCLAYALKDICYRLMCAC